MGNYYEGTLSNSNCSTSANCAYYAYDTTNGNITVEYSLSGYGFSVTKTSITDIRKAISAYAAGNLTTSSLATPT